MSGMNSNPGISGVMRALVGSFVIDVVVSMMRTVATAPSGTSKSLVVAMVGWVLSCMTMGVFGDAMIKGYSLDVTEREYRNGFKSESCLVSSSKMGCLVVQISIKMPVAGRLAFWIPHPRTVELISTMIGLLRPISTGNASSIAGTFRQHLMLITLISVDLHFQLPTCPVLYFAVSGCESLDSKL